MTKEIIDFKKRLRFPFRQIADVMPMGFSDDDFYRDFKQFFPILWQEIQIRYQSDIKKYNVRLKKGLKAIKPLSPNKFLSSAASGRIRATRNLHKNGVSNDDNHRVELRNILVKKAEVKLRKQLKKEDENKKFFQVVHPSYATDLMRLYFEKRKNNTLDVNTRFLIIIEAAKFKCSKTISFLEKVNACEKNDDLRYMAFHYLQRLGCYPKLGRKRKGRQRLSQTKLVDITKNPTELIQMIWANQHLIHKRFDIFLSHSYSDKSKLLEIKDILNSQGFTVYIDWVCDAEMLERSNQNEDTINVLKERLNQSDKFLLIESDRSIVSDMVRLEIETFRASGRPMFKLIEETITVPESEIIKVIPECKREDRKIVFTM